MKNLERNRHLGRLRYSLDRERILRQKRGYYRRNRPAVKARQAEYRAHHPFMSTPGRRRYMRVYMREWRAR
jgi:hypothetical protein